MTIKHQDRANGSTFFTHRDLEKIFECIDFYKQRCLLHNEKQQMADLIDKIAYEYEYVESIKKPRTEMYQ